MITPVVKKYCQSVVRVLLSTPTGFSYNVDIMQETNMKICLCMFTCVVCAWEDKEECDGWFQWGIFDDCQDYSPAGFADGQKYCADITGCLGFLWDVFVLVAACWFYCVCLYSYGVVFGCRQLFSGRSSKHPLNTNLGTRQKSYWIACGHCEALNSYVARYLPHEFVET